MSGKTWEERNTVTSKDQVSQYVTFEGVRDGSPKIMFVGNSITRHAPKPDIGWYGDWGMAASAKENDYVHQVIKGVRETKPDAEFCIVQAAVWERSYKNCDYEAYFKEATVFKPDIIICSISGNIPKAEFEIDAFKVNIDKLFKYLSGGRADVQIVLSSAFFGDPEKCKAIWEYTQEYGAKHVEISDIVKNKDNLAIGQFEHEGVQIHPGDKGMKELAKRYLEAIKEYLK